MPGGYDSIPGAGVSDWLSGLWDTAGLDDTADGDEIRLAQSPQWGLTVQPSFFSAPEVVVQQSGLCKWIRKLDGTVALAAKPDMVLTVEGYLGTGHTRIVVATAGSVAPPAVMWKIDAEGRIMLEHSPDLGLSVPYGKFESGAPVILSNVTVAGENNKFRLNAASDGSLQAATPSKLRISGSRGDPNTLWTSLTGAITYQQGYIAISQAYRDADSSWAYVTENPHHPQIASFVKEPWGSKGFLLKLVEGKGKAKNEPRYMSCILDLTDDRRDENSTWVYVTKKRTLASAFEEESTKEGLVLKSGSSYLCCAKFKDRPTEFGSDYTWLYSVHSSHLAACVVVEALPDAKQEEPWWKAFLRKYQKHIQLFLILLGVLVVVSIILAISQPSPARDDPLQIIVPYDCNHQPERMWSNTKTAWCCKHHTLGCPTTEAPARAPVGGVPGVPGTAGTMLAPKTADDDCFTDVLNWQRDWTISKQNFCCEKHGIACKAALTTPAFNCNEDYHSWTERWSYRKKLWCCLHHERGCPAGGQVQSTFDCAAGYEDSDTWAQEKREWCCYHASVGCPTSPSAKYNCDAGYTNWLHGWSEGKKVWCCFHSGRACSETSNDKAYDCDAGFDNWQVGWSNSKIDFCCQTQQKGCAHVV